MAWIPSLWSSSSFWEGVEYIAETTVIIGATFELLADFEHILKGDEKKERRHRVAKWAAIALIIGLAVGLGALVRTNRLFTDTITTLYGQARDANNRANATENARIAMLEELKPRNFTKEQMDAFIAAIKGKVPTLNVFTIAIDAEASRYGEEILYGLQEAGVKVSWYRMREAYFNVPGVSLMGLTLVDNPKNIVALRDILFEAFCGKPIRVCVLASIGPDPRFPRTPTPSLYIGLKQPPFMAAPGFVKGSQAIRLPAPVADIK